MDRRAVLHIDMDAFYTQVEHNRLGISREEPLAVVQWEGLIAVNYPARAAGITRHDKASVALQKCPTIRLAHVEYIGAEGPADNSSVIRRGSQDPADSSQREECTEQVIGAPTSREVGKACLNRYRVSSSSIFRVMARMAEVCEKGSLDEAYLDVSKQALAAVAAGPHAHWLRDSSRADGADGQASALDDEESSGGLGLSQAAVSWAGHVYSGEADGEASSQALPTAQCVGDLVLHQAGIIADQIRAAVWAECGITCAAGIAHNKMLAKLASAMHKPNMQTTVLQRGVPGLFRTLPLSKINGMGPKIRKRLEEHFGATEAGDVLRYSEQQLAAKLGSGEARHVLRVCNGQHESAVADRKETKNFMARKSFSTLHDLARVDHWIQVFAAELVGRIVTDTRTPRTLAMMWRGPGGTLAGRRKQVVMPRNCRQPGVLLEAARAIAKSIGKQLVPLNTLALIAEGLEAPDSSSKSISSFFKPVAGAARASSPDAAATAIGGDDGDDGSMEGDDVDDGAEDVWEGADDDIDGGMGGGGDDQDSYADGGGTVPVDFGASTASGGGGMTASQEQKVNDRRNANIAGGTFITAKAGMGGVDKALVQDTVFALSKGSKHYENEHRKAAAVDAKIDAIRQKLRQPLTDAAKAAASKAIDYYVSGLEGARDLTRTHLVVDMDAFYAAVEERANPALKDVPFAVGGIGMICTANYVARRYGVRSAMPGFIAVELCKRQGIKLQFVPTHFDLYTAASKEVRVFFAEIDPQYHMGSLDEAYLGATFVLTSLFCDCFTTD